MTLNDLTSSTTVNKKTIQTRKLTCLEMFAGPGGLALGTHRAGFTHLALVEFDHTAAETLRFNRQGLLEADPRVVLEQDARAIDYSAYAGKVDLLAAGPPCQPFSGGGAGQGADDPRNMFPTLLNAVATMMPRSTVIENVRGITTSRFDTYFHYILMRLTFPLVAPRPDETWELHYRRLGSVRESDFSAAEQNVAWYQLVDAADHGVPQRRHRVFILAIRRDLNLEPFKLPRTHSRLALLYDQWITKGYWERHGISPSNYVEPSDEHTVNRLPRTFFTPDGLAPWRTVRDAFTDLPAPVARGEPETLANHVQHPGARIYNGHLGSKLDYPAKALKAGAHGTPGGENMVRVPGGGVRYFTTREAARLQTFPDNWVFRGPWGACIRQLGNAVPVELAALFTREIHRRLLGADTASMSLNGHDRSLSTSAHRPAESFATD